MALNFELKATDKISPAADSAASSLGKLDAAIRAESATLRQLQAQMAAVQRGSQVDLETYRKLSTATQAQRDKVAGLTSEMVKAGGAGFAPAKQGADKLSEALRGVITEGGSADGVLAALGPEAVAASAGFAALAGGILAAAGAAVYLGTKLVELGVQASETKGDITRSLELLYGSQQAADHTYKVLESITNDIAISQRRVNELANKLVAAGQVNGDAMVRSIEAIGRAEAVRKEAGKTIEDVITRSTQSRMFSVSRQELMTIGASYRDISKEISKNLGISVAEAEIRLRTGGVRMQAGIDALTTVVNRKMSDLANQKFMTVSVQLGRLHELFNKMFEDVDEGPMARAIQRIANLFSESSVSGRAMRTLIVQAFSDMARAAEAAAPYVELFFKGVALFALTAYNATYPVRKVIHNMFGGHAKGIEAWEDAIVGAADSFGKALGSAMALLAGILSVTDQIVKKWQELGDTAQTVLKSIALAPVKMLPGVGTLSQGKSLVDGIVAGVEGGAGLFESAMQRMANRGLAAFDLRMGIHSPSTVMQLRGRYLDEGTAKGVNDNSDVPAAAMADAGSGIAAAVKPRGVTGRSGGGVVVHVTFQAGAVQVGTSGKLGAELENELTEMMASVFQRAALMTGAGG